MFQKCPPSLLHAETDAVGVVMTVLVHLARIVLVIVLVVRENDMRVLVGVGSVFVDV